jgi:small ubiquitin-related modifier
LAVKSPDGEITHFKVKKGTKFSKVIQAFSTRKGISPGAIRLMLDGQTLNADQTPEELDIGDGDQIDAMYEQTGGY